MNPERANGTVSLLTVREVAELLRVSPSTVYRLVNRGQLARVRLGGRALFRLDDVHALVARPVLRDGCDALACHAGHCGYLTIVVDSTGLRVARNGLCRAGETELERYLADRPELRSLISRAEALEGLRVTTDAHGP